MKKCVIITAAGMSTRQKRNKLLIRACHETIIEKTINNFLNIGLDIFVVVGHEKNKVKPILEHRFGNDIEIVDNDNYKTGIASSIQAGILAVGDKYEYYGFCNGDKPFIKTISVEKMIKYIDSKKPKILVPLFQDKIGHPTFFKSEYSKYFMNLSSDVGGIDIINKHPKLVTYLPIDDDGITLDMDIYLDEK
jgi:molybdenum cofactor cytidylyltransferase